MDSIGPHPLATEYGRRFARRIAQARADGYSRRIIAEQAGLTPQILRRIEHHHYAFDDECEQLNAVFTRIEAGELQPARRGRPRSQTSPTARLERARHVLAGIPPDATDIGVYRDAVDDAIDIIDETDQ